MNASIFRKKGWTTLAVLIVSVLLAGPALAQMSGHGSMGSSASKHRSHRSNHSMGSFDVESMKSRLNLSEDQAEKLGKLRTQYRKDMIQMKADIKIAEIDLWEVFGSKDLTKAKAEKQVKKLEALRSKIMLYRVKSLLETKKFLSDKQFEGFRKMSFRSMRGGYKGKHRGQSYSPPITLMPQMRRPGMPPGMPPIPHGGNIPGYEDYYDNDK